MSVILERLFGRQAMLAAVEDTVAKATRDTNRTLPTGRRSRSYAQASPGQLEGIPLQVVIAGKPSVSFQREEWTPGHGLDDWPNPD